MLTAAGKAFAAIAKLYERQKNKLECATSWCEAANCYRKVDINGMLISVNFLCGSAIVRANLKNL